MRTPGLKFHTWIKIGTMTWKCAKCELLKEILYDRSAPNKQRIIFSYKGMEQLNLGCK